jgi:adenosylcobinamide kinase / adenosylcobinamide-phosphate guanylyltransferase
MIVLIGGGSRSGKSRYALEYAKRTEGPRAFIATAEALDEEMRSRVLAHRTERGDEFATIEEPLELVAALPDGYRTVVVDCLTLWISNLMAAARDVYGEAEALLDRAAESAATVILVTNEVGCGIVPENAVARQFRDAAGHVNQRAAARSAEAWWMAFGVPLRLK